MIRTKLATIFLGTILLIATASLAGLEPGAEAPGFTLTDTEGTEHTLQVYLDDGKTVVLEWFNPDCPFIKKHHLNHKTMDETFAAVKESGVVWLAINSNAKGKQGHGLERNRKAVKDYEMSFPVLIDESGEVGRAYGAKTTPHMFIITAEGLVVYNGAIDDDRSPAKLGETNFVASALAALREGKAVETAETQAYGCSVKYGP
ncbi:MAG: thioredoxin family protein [Candidatus Krumholzibacteriota bacterium]